MKPRPDELTRALVSLADHLAEFTETLTNISAAVQADDDDARQLSNIWPLVALTRSLSAEVIAVIELAVRQ